PRGGVRPAVAPGHGARAQDRPREGGLRRRRGRAGSLRAPRRRAGAGRYTRLDRCMPPWQHRRAPRRSFRSRPGGAESHRGSGRIAPFDNDDTRSFMRSILAATAAVALLGAVGMAPADGAFADLGQAATDGADRPTPQLAAQYRD